MRPTLKDVAQAAGVNFTLVSKYLNGDPQARMKPETRERIRRAVETLRYRPSAPARALRSGRSRIVGMVSGDLTNAFWAHFAGCAMRRLKERGYQLYSYFIMHTIPLRVFYKTSRHMAGKLYRKVFL